MRRRTTRLACVLVLAVLVVAGVVPTARAATTVLTNYLVVSPAPGPLAATVTSIRAQGGTVLQQWPEIGVVVVESQRADFAHDLRGDPGVLAVGATRAMAAKQPYRLVTDAAPAGPLGPGTTGGRDETEPEFAKQWDMRQIGAEKAHLTTDGSRSVTVGVLDSGVDPTHPDLQANVDARLSVGCTNDGRPDTRPAAWQPTGSGHGTHVAGTIAAARNGVGIIGVAPNVRLASVKVVDEQGYIYPEYAICGFMWAGQQRLSVTNNSYFIDPWGLWCASSPDQQAVIWAVNRALAWSGSRDVVNVAAAGNARWDLAGSITDKGSPNNGTPTERVTDQRCVDIPAEGRDAITVSAVGPTGRKAYYSNFGHGVIDITAPGGDAWLNWRDERAAETDAIYSTLPGGTYGWQQGTSMAAPHVTGVVALLRSTRPELNAGQVREVLLAQATPKACPVKYDYTGDGRPDAICTGGAGEGFYGAGLVNAAAAVTP
ncbi:S8 family peptidase [Propionibacteriaceae bacterium Y2011]|uniref:S8 family peptidase n=1 Tax=Microlunatus sp. Y2014 TaxID=3418488 RepID=UPI003B4A5AC4